MQQQLTRRALYDLVWAQPMTKVAADLGISDVALYWAKHQAGKPVRPLHFLKPRIRSRSPW